MSRLLKTLRIWLVPLLALVFLGLSFTDLLTYKQRIRRLTHVENQLHKRQAMVADYAQAALEDESDAWMERTGVPEDIVIYKYWGDSLVAWVNTFPIINDDLLESRLTPTNVFFSRNRLQQSVLMQVNATEQYQMLGSAWYVTRAFVKANVTVITGIFIRSEYAISNAFVHNSVNTYLRIPQYATIQPLNQDEGFVVFGRGGGVLFSLISDVKTGQEGLRVLMRWLCISCLLLWLLLLFYAKPTPARLLWAVPVLLAMRLVPVFPFFKTDITLFSPMLYADNWLRNSLPSVLWGAVIIFAICGMFNRVKFALARRLRRGGWRRWLIMGAYIVGPVYLIIAIHRVLRSIILHSSIVLSLNRLDEVNRYTFLAYIAFSLFFLSLWYCLRCWMVYVHRRQIRTLYRRRWLVAFLAIISVYTLLAVCFYGERKETRRNLAWAQKMAITRDLEFEIKLKKADYFIASDPVIAAMVHTGQQNDVLTRRLAENYFAEWLDRYNMSLTICAPGDMLLAEQGTMPVNCYQFFHANVLRNGLPLDENSHFYFVNNNLGTAHYLGMFTYYSSSYGSHDLYIELESHYVKDALGYPSLLLDNARVDRFPLPYDHSYAKYLGGKLVASSGNYAYAGTWLGEVKDGFHVVKEKDAVHYRYKTGEAMILISRPTHKLFPNLVALSYIFLFFLFFAAILPDIWRREKNRTRLRGSFRGKITILIVSSLMVALVFMASGSIYFAVRVYDSNLKRQIHEKLNIAQQSMEDYFGGLTSLQDQRLNYYNVSELLNRLSSNVNININLYDLQGRIVNSSQPELYEKHLAGSRMNDKAFYHVSRMKQPEFVQKERVGTFSFYALYAPLYNRAGNLMAYMNVPYYTGRTDVNKELLSVVAAVLNIYILLMLASLLGGMMLSNQISRPIEDLSRKMRQIDVTKKSEHIDYPSSDELGELVKAYNQMVDDLEESSQRLAQTERERTWREMARQIAHEIKNPLTPMRLSIQHLVRMKNAGAPDWEDRFDNLAVSLLEQIDIVADAAGEFSNFSKFFNEEPVPIEVNALVREQIPLFATADNITIETEFRSPRADVLARRSQLTRVFVNLITNAQQALEHQGRGLIHIMVAAGLNAEGVGKIIIQIADNGPGVPKNLQHRLFTPNFTTKSSGTGLGLAISRTIVEQSGGTINYSTSQWGGACFTIILPQHHTA